MFWREGANDEDIVKRREEGLLKLMPQRFVLVDAPCLDVLDSIYRLRE